MKNAIVFSSLFFLIGIGFATMILTNPLHREWVRQIRDSLPGTAMTPGQDRAGEAPSTQAVSTGPEERKIKYWVAPMDPTYISDQPGKSPMDMDLIPVYEDEVADIPGVVQIDPVFVQNISVQSPPVLRTDIPFTIRTVGTFTYDQGQIHVINTKYEGWIENAEVNYIGESIQQGQRLFDIFSPQMVAAQQEYLDAVAYMKRLSTSDYPGIIARARSLVDASRQRLRYWDITDVQIDELEKMPEPRRTLPVLSPVDGVVVEKMGQALEGMFAQPGMNLYKIVDLSTIWLEAEVFEDQIPWLDVGQRAVVEVGHQPGRRYVGTVRYVYPFFDQDTRTLRLSIEIGNPGGELRADMYANVTFDVPSALGVIAVPEEAVIRSGERNVVVIDLGDGTFQVREVDLGVNGNGSWEVRAGLAEGNRVVVSSQFLIDSESNLREAIRKLISRDTNVGSEESGEAASGPNR